MKPLPVPPLPLVALLSAVAAGCGGDVDASGCFTSEELAEGRRVGVAISNSCDLTATCVIEVAYRCDEQLMPQLSATFTLEPVAVTEQWVEIPCAGSYRYAVAWQCADEGTPEVPDPSI